MLLKLNEVQCFDSWLVLNKCWQKLKVNNILLLIAHITIFNWFMVLFDITRFMCHVHCLKLMTTATNRKYQCIPWSVFTRNLHSQHLCGNLSTVGLIAFYMERQELRKLPSPYVVSTEQTSSLSKIIWSRLCY